MRCSGLDGKFKESCAAMFHLAQLWQTFISIFLVGEINIFHLKLKALIVIQ